MRKSAKQIHEEKRQSRTRSHLLVKLAMKIKVATP